MCTRRVQAAYFLRFNEKNLNLNDIHPIQYDWLWKSEKDAEYNKFALDNPTLDDYEAQLRRFGKIQVEIDSVSSIHLIGALSLNTKHLKLHLGRECDNWKFKVRRYFLFSTRW